MNRLVGSLYNMFCLKNTSVNLLFLKEPCMDYLPSTAGGRNKPRVSIFGKVHIFWEGHKILRNLHRRFDRYYIGQIYGGDFAKICGHLRIYELKHKAKKTVNKLKFLYSGKCLRNLHRRFVLCSNGQIYGGDFAKFCGLLMIYEL